MKFLRVVAVITLLLVIIGAGFVYIGLPRLNSFQAEGTLQLPGLSKPVKVIRDEKGMAYIYADDLLDAVYAQGFVTAQDRLFQMQVTRLLAQGRICELASEKAKSLDVMYRTIGIHRMAKRHAEIVDERTRAFFQKYVDGINAFMERTPKDIHLEFKLARIKPEPWTIADSLSVLYFMAWDTSANIKSEIVAQMLAEKLGLDKANELVPININPDEPADHSKRSAFALKDFKPLNIAPDRSLLAYLNDSSYQLGSNNWAVSPRLAAGGKPILAGDPHLDARILPGVWYPCGLVTPQGRMVGVNIPGIPGLVMGRNDYVAMAMTNAYGDVQDLYVETLDLNDSKRYMEGAESHAFDTIEETLKIRDKSAPGGYKEEKLRIRFTKRGPVVSGVLPGLNTKNVVTLRWAAYETMGPQIEIGEQLLKARSVNDVREAVRYLNMIVLNLVFADRDGNIGWQVSGKLPIRAAGTGSVPHTPKDGKDNWIGWIPFEEMPQSMNPERGWVGTCNHKTVSNDYPYYYSSYASPSYRYSRLIELLDSEGTKSADDHWKFQRDDMNLMAKSVAPIMARALMAHEDTREMGKVLSRWDFKDDLNAAAPAIFQAVYVDFARLVFEDELGPELAATMLKVWYFWEERLMKMVLDGSSSWFDIVTTKDRQETMNDLFHQAGQEVLKRFGATLGKDPNKWLWGSMHQIEFVNPIRREGAGKSLLGGGSHPMSGSGETLYRAWYAFDKPFGVTNSASLRMIVDFADDDKILAVLPGGVCGRSFHPHQKDQIEAFMRGDKRNWWFSDRAIKEHAKTVLVLAPR